MIIPERVRKTVITKVLWQVKFNVYMELKGQIEWQKFKEQAGTQLPV